MRDVPQTTCEVRTGPHRLTVEIAPRRCHDAMSGEPFPASVTVTIDASFAAAAGRWSAEGRRDHEAVRGVRLQADEASPAEAGHGD